MLNAIRTGLQAGRVVPYLGPGMIAPSGQADALPDSHLALAARFAAAVTVPHKIRNNVTAAAQFVENFKHRKTVAGIMQQAFAPRVAPGKLHRYLSVTSKSPLLVHAWYDDLPQQALAPRRDWGMSDWGMIQGLSQAEHFGTWTRAYRPDGSAADPGEPALWPTILYQPLGSVAPASNFLISDSDFVEVLTEIDIQTPIPAEVQALRAGRSFLFLGCRFATQIERIFAHQIIKRASDRHWAVLSEEPTRNERRFLERHGIERVELTLPEFAEALAAGESLAA